MPKFDTVIKDGTIIDGLRTPRYKGDIGIINGKVASIGGINADTATNVIDAEGKIVAPGVIDLHTHYDSQIYWDPWCSISSWHGVTSVVIGNCGFGFAPCKPEDQERSMLTMTRNEAVPYESMQAGMPWDWETFPEFLDSMDRTPKGVNVLTYMPLNPLMAYVMGLPAAKERGATDAEMAEMTRLMSEGLDAGACGFSAQLQTTAEFEPQRDVDGSLMITNTMQKKDLMAFAGVLRDKGRGFIQCIGASRELTEEMAAVSGRPVIYNVLAALTDQHGTPLGDYRDAIRWLDDCNERGLRIHGQSMSVENDYQYTLEDWNLFDTHEVWRDVLMGTPEERIKKLSAPENRRRIREYCKDGFVSLAFDTDLIIGVTYHPDQADLEGMTIGELAAQRNCDLVDAFLDVSLKDDLKTIFVTSPRPVADEILRDIITSNQAVPGLSDGGAHTKIQTLGRYPTDLLANLIRDRKLTTLEEAHWRLSTYSAMAAGIQDRGFLKEGAPADILVYDLDALHVGEVEKAYDFPAGAWRLVQRPRGYEHILVNGIETFTNGECTGATPGQLLRFGNAD